MDSSDKGKRKKIWIYFIIIMVVIILIISVMFILVTRTCTLLGCTSSMIVNITRPLPNNFEIDINGLHLDSCGNDPNFKRVYRADDLIFSHIFPINVNEEWLYPNQIQMYNYINEETGKMLSLVESGNYTLIYTTPHPRDEPREVINQKFESGEYTSKNYLYKTLSLTITQKSSCQENAEKTVVYQNKDYEIEYTKQYPNGKRCGSPCYHAKITNP